MNKLLVAMVLVCEVFSAQAMHDDVQQKDMTVVVAKDGKFKTLQHVVNDNALFGLISCGQSVLPVVGGSCAYIMGSSCNSHQVLIGMGMSSCCCLAGTIFFCRAFAGQKELDELKKSSVPEKLKMD